MRGVTVTCEQCELEKHEYFTDYVLDNLYLCTCAYINVFLGCRLQLSCIVLKQTLFVVERSREVLSCQNCMVVAMSGPRG